MARIRSSPRHEVSDEEPPENRFHQPEFQNAFCETKQLIVGLSNVLASNQLHSEPDTTMRRLYDEASELGAFSCPDTRTVGFVGDSGVGKSSLINSLLDIKGLARASASGRACTCVVTEYCYRPEPGFKIEVEYFTREELENQISELLESYRHFHLADLEDHEISEFEDRARIAEYTFRSMFPARLEDLESELLSDEEEDAVLQKLMYWLDDSPRSATVHESIADVELCSQRLTELTSESEDVNETALWPFIRKIRVYCNAVILSKGLILVDLPGLRDTNAARRNITERYILNCDEIFAVCNIIRAITDAGVQAVIDLADRASLSNVGIICTRSDDIRVEEARSNRRPDVSDMLEVLRTRLTAAQQYLRTIEEGLRYYDELDEDDFLDEERDTYIRERRRATNAKRVVEDREFASFLIRTRNDSVCQQLRDIYAERIPGDNLAVFCVSNLDYWRHRDLPRDVSWRHLELSGMIDVRKHCISIVAESQLRAARLYMEQRIPALLESLQLWVQSGSGSLSAERKAAIRATLDDVERILPTYAAFCRNFGDHTTAVAGTRNWNEEAIGSMVLALSPEWRNLCRKIEVQGRSAIAALQTLCDQVVDVLGSEEALDGDQADILTDSIRTQQSLLEARLEELYTGVRSDLAHLRPDVLSGIRTSFIGQAMRESYRACNRESGTGSHNRRKTIINRRLNGEQIFLDMETQLRARMNAIAEDFRERRMEATRAHFQVIRNNLDMLRDENVILEAESDPEFRMRIDEEVLRVRARLDSLVVNL
ncbi:hypothetical protein GE09DRAFT_1174162 [Coniochaeta sp. 2T2.1]|nr:hypothetical protein GE09DRAFT_1174162 [Coniochaeta sp. 2T2.1]